MLKILNFNQLSSAEKNAILKRVTIEEETDVRRTVVEILDKVQREGIPAVIEYTKKFDGVELSNVLASPEEFENAEKELAPEAKEAFEKAAENIREFHEMQMEDIKNREKIICGSRLGYKFVPIEGAAAYAPGGTAIYPSSVLMGIIPARIAGVESPLLITPPGKNGKLHPSILFCARLAGAERVLKAGGVQGIAAAAFGLAGPPARLISGPGNKYVTAAKSILSDRGIIRMDMPAGPSEVVIIADESADPRFIAADLLSQAEHGADSAAVLLTNSRELAEKTATEVERGIAERSARREMKTTSIKERSYAIIFENLSDAVEFSNEYAPEHLEICTRDPENLFGKITSAGSVFLGHYAPVALGDYFSGTNHVLPTNGAGKFYSGLGVDIFLKRISYQFPTKESLKTALDPILVMSRLEGFDQEHGHSAQVRFE